MEVTLAQSVDAFFHDAVAEAFAETAQSASPEVGYYLVSLLGEFTTARIDDAPLGLKLVADQVPAAERVRRLKEVGDTSLYVAGYFADSLNRSLVDVEYYVGLGQRAFAELAKHMAPGARGTIISTVYAELADHFPRFVDVLAAVRRRIDYATADLTKLYELWLRTRDAWIERRLRQAGLIVGEVGRGIQ